MVLRFTKVRSPAVRPLLHFFATITSSVFRVFAGTIVLENGLRKASVCNTFSLPPLFRETRQERTSNEEGATKTTRIIAIVKVALPNTSTTSDSMLAWRKAYGDIAIRNLSSGDESWVPAPETKGPPREKK